jgi:CheY-like chemotaxis protein
MQLSVTGHEIWYLICEDFARLNRFRYPCYAMSTAYDLKILLVEDSVGLRRVYQKLLEACGYRVRVAEHGADALAILRDEDFDIIISDIGMPVMDGYEFARHVRSNPAYNDKRLIALTAYSQPSLVEQARSVGFDSYLTKPINIHDLREAIHSRPVATDYLNSRPIESQAKPEVTLESPLRTELRTATRELHDDLEQQLGLTKADRDLAHYRHYLERTFGYYLPLEQRLLRASQSHDWFSEVLTRCKTSALQEDLRWLGTAPQTIETLPKAERLPRIDTLDDILGVLYVLEGATLGGQVLSKHFNNRWGIVRHSGATFINVYGNQTADYWARFLRWLETSAVDNSRVVAAAKETFQTLASWLSADDTLIVRMGTRNIKTLHGKSLRSNHLR